MDFNSFFIRWWWWWRWGWKSVKMEGSCSIFCDTLTRINKKRKDVNTFREFFTLRKEMLRKNANEVRGSRVIIQILHSCKWLVRMRVEHKRLSKIRILHTWTNSFISFIHFYYKMLSVKLQYLSRYETIKSYISVQSLW